MRKLLKWLWVLQEVSNKNRKPTLGKGYSKAHRLNPFNPLTYFVLVIILVVGIILFGVVGFWREVDLQNPFKWN